MWGAQAQRGEGQNRDAHNGGLRAQSMGHLIVWGHEFRGE